jgi:hypothetical protein
VLGEAHGPADDDAVGVEHHGQRLFDGLAVQPGGAFDIVGVELAGGLLVLGEAMGVRGDELLVERALR